jgi:hypothetical protein
MGWHYCKLASSQITHDICVTTPSKLMARPENTRRQGRDGRDNRDGADDWGSPVQEAEMVTGRHRPLAKITDANAIQRLILKTTSITGV